MRAFIAIELPQEIKEALNRLQQKLKTAEADIKWVEPKNIHLTLKFLGEIDEQTRSRINSSLEGICRIRKPFMIAISSLGAFPNTASPRIIWLGIKQGNNEVKEICQTMEKHLTVPAIPKEEKEFCAHITIGRTHSGKNRQELAKLLIDLSKNLSQSQFQVSKITFFKSALTPRGPIYEVIQEFPLSNL